MDSNDVLEGKLLAGKSGYDVVVPSASFFGMQVKGGLYQPIPKAKLKNYGNLDPLLLKQLDLFDPGNVYGVPYMWGTTGIAFNVDAIKARMPDAPTDSWKMLFDPAVVSKFKDCGVAMLDAGDDVVESALIYLGHDPNSESPADLRDAIDVITKIQPYLRYFHSTSYIDDLANGEICLALGYSGDVFQATRNARPGVKIDYRDSEGRRDRLDRRDGDSERCAASGRRGEVDRSHSRSGRGRRNFQRDHVREPQQGFQAAARSGRCATTRSSFRRADVMARLIAISPKSERFVRMRNRAWTQAKAGG